ncbi:hypothetical protein D3C75_1167950 [compost metagenome]
MMPSQNAGTHCPRRASMRIRLSIKLLRFTAEIMPAGMPVTSEMTSAVNASLTVAGSRSSTTFIAGRS